MMERLHYAALPKCTVAVLGAKAKTVKRTAAIREVEMVA